MTLLLLVRHSPVVAPVEDEGRSSTGRLPVAWPPPRRGELSHVRVERGVVPKLPAIAFDDFGTVDVQLGGYGTETHTVVYADAGTASMVLSGSASESHTAFVSSFGYEASVEEDALALAALLADDPTQVPLLYRLLLEERL